MEKKKLLYVGNSVKEEFEVEAIDFKKLNDSIRGKQYFGVIISSEIYNRLDENQKALLLSVTRQLLYSI